VDGRALFYDAAGTDKPFLAGATSDVLLTPQVNSFYYVMSHMKRSQFLARPLTFADKTVLLIIPLWQLM
jgi:hypothetical protein